jgi:hypothetical protein
VVLLLRRADGVVGVDDGNDVQLEKFVYGGEQLEKIKKFEMIT